MKTDIRVVRMIVASSATLFGSLWISFAIAKEVAPPEPSIATLGRWACLALFIISLLWGIVLYAAYAREQRSARTRPADTRNGAGRDEQ